MKMKIIAICLYFVVISCAPPVTVTVPFSDDFERDRLGDNYYMLENADWEIKNGALHSSNAKNVPLWLKLKLPENVVIEFDAWAEKTNFCDLKCEMFADGRIHASGYIIILGGWKNQISTIARLDEHEKTRLEKRPTGCDPKARHHFKIVRYNGKIEWYLNGSLYMERTDREPLYGAK
ncbi:MAG: hypothetical protein N3B13_05355, partial [Deltaproteobacteria bacterium]|nr:hypothetical protein [Deltaproteobacteria bacterium]